MDIKEFWDKLLKLLVNLFKKNNGGNNLHESSTEPIIKDQGTKTVIELVNDFEEMLKKYGLKNIGEIKYKAGEKFTEEIKSIIYSNSSLREKREKLLEIVNKDIDDINALKEYKHNILSIFHKDFSDKFLGKSSIYLPSLYQSLANKFRITANDSKEVIEELIQKLIEDGVNSVKRKISVNVDWLRKRQDEESIKREIEDIKRELKLDTEDKLV